MWKQVRFFMRLVRHRFALWFPLMYSTSNVVNVCMGANPIPCSLRHPLITNLCSYMMHEEAHHLPSHHCRSSKSAHPSQQRDLMSTDISDAQSQHQKQKPSLGYLWSITFPGWGLFLVSRLDVITQHLCFSSWAPPAFSFHRESWN